MARQDLSVEERKKLMLSHQTIEGLKITGTVYYIRYIATYF
jgi:hypothetical protein